MNATPTIPEKKPNRVKWYGIVLGIIYLIMQHRFYLWGHDLAELFKVMEPFSPKIPFDDLIPLVSIFIIPYVWAYASWGMAPMAVSKCEKSHFADYMAANLVACVAGMIALAFAPTYMNRVTEGLYAAAENPDVFDRLRLFWYSMDGSEWAYNLLPSFHCINSTLAYLGVMGRKEIPKWFRIYSLVLAFLVFAATLFVKQHFFLDVVSGVALAAIAYFICKKFHWGRMFIPVEKLYAKIAEKIKENKENKHAA